MYVLHNDSEVEPYVEMHKDILRGLNQNRNENWTVREHNQSFIPWFKDHIFSKLHSDPATITERLRCLAYGPSLHVFLIAHTQLMDTHFIPKNKMIKLLCKIVVSPCL